MNDSMLTRIRATKSIEAMAAQSGSGTLHRTMGLWQLTAFGLAAIIGTGIFVGLGGSVADAGPAVTVSYILAGIVSVFGALAYAELSGAIPASGSAYSYTYATLGQGAAFLIGWCLFAEYGVSVSTVAVGWGEYLNKLLDSMFGWQIPAAFSAPPGDGGRLNLPAFAIVMLAAVLLVRGIRESARVNAVMVAVKIGVLVIFIAVAATGFKSGNLSPFAPSGWDGVAAATTGAFFAFIGFDAVSTASEEVKDPKKNLPRAIFICMGVTTLLYVLVALVATGAMDSTALGAAKAPLATVIDTVVGGHWGGGLIAFGALMAIASVVFAVLYGQTRIFMSMSRDGMLPAVFAKVSPKTHTPVINTWLTALVLGAIAAVVPLEKVMDLTTIGTFAILAVINVAVMVLRYKHPELARGFKMPLFPVTPLLGLAASLYLMITQHDGETWRIFGAWLLVGAAVYFFYVLRRKTAATH